MAHVSMLLPTVVLVALPLVIKMFLFPLCLTGDITVASKMIFEGTIVPALGGYASNRLAKIIKRSYQLARLLCMARCFVYNLQFNHVVFVI